jgi:hypothetical protein
MTTMTSAGTKLAISAAAPATQTGSGYAALTYTEVGQVESIGAFGANTEMVEFQPLRGARQSHKGGTNYGSLSPSIAHDDTDAGQTLLRTASDDATALYSFEVTYPSGAKRYFQGRVFGYPENVGAANAMLMANPSIGISTAIIKVAPGS